MRTLVHLAAVAGLVLIEPAHADQARTVVVRPIISATRTASGQPIRFPHRDARIIASEFTIAPGAKLAVHKHPFLRLAYVLEGRISVTDQDSGQTFVYKAGDMIVEVIDQWHFGTNTGHTPVRLLVIDEVEGNRSNTILKQ